VLAAYAAPAFSQTLIHGPTGSVIQGVYAKYFGIPLHSIAVVLLVTSLFDATVNPLAGYLSDRYCASGGSRKPWLLGGSLVSIVACWFLYAPTGSVTVAYFLTWLLITYASWATAEVPYAAWMAEVTSDYDERTRLATWRGVAMYGGAMAFAAIPYLPFLPTSEFTPASLRWTAILAAIALPTFATIAVLTVPAGAAAVESGTARNVWRGVFTNRPLLLFALMFFLYHAASGISTGMIFFYLDSHLHQGPFMAGLLLLSLPLGALAVPGWGFLCRRYGKQRAWAAGAAGGALATLLFATVPAGPSGTAWLVCVQVLVILVYAGFPVAAPAVLADVIDYGRLRFGVDYGGTYFAVYNIMYKAVPGIGAAAGIALVELGGFDPRLAQQSPAATLVLLATFCALPALLLAIVAPLLWYFPINARRQRIIVARLKRRDERNALRPSLPEVA
jgi:GPH family glycoside/pentoside/hexuronide:cation symporter